MLLFKKLLFHIVPSYLNLFLFISVTLKAREPMDAESFVSVVGTAADEIREVYKERKSVEETPSRVQETPQLRVTDKDDDWFVWLDVVRGERTYAPPGIDPPTVSTAFLKMSFLYHVVGLLCSNCFCLYQLS